MADASRFKIAVKSRRIGFTFATTLEIALDAISHRTRWLIISRTQDAAKEALREIGNHFKAINLAVAAQAVIRDEETDLEASGEQLVASVERKSNPPSATRYSPLANMRILKFVIELPNGSEITAMTAHPDAARGFGGNFFLDEFGFHRDSYELWKGAAAAVMRGHRLIVVSTPHYQIGKFYELARECDLVSGRPPLARPMPDHTMQISESGIRNLRSQLWSAHWVDIHTAAPQLRDIGVPLDLAELRALAGDEETWNQEFCCQFLSPAEMWLPLELIAAARSPQASSEWPIANSQAGIGTSPFANGSLYLGADIGRQRDRTAIWIDERIADVAICRGVILLDRLPFERQYEVFCSLLSQLSSERPAASGADRSALVTRRSPLAIRRACIDQTGIGMALVERLQEKFGSRVEGITFTNDIKERMSLLVRRRLEERLDKIPAHGHESRAMGDSLLTAGSSDMRSATPAEIERDFAAIKRETTASGNLRFDAVRSDASHADIYWAKALADLAADSGVSAAACFGNEEASGEWQAASGEEAVSLAPLASRYSLLTGNNLRPIPSIWDSTREYVGVQSP